VEAGGSALAGFAAAVAEGFNGDDLPQAQHVVSGFLASVQDRRVAAGRDHHEVTIDGEGVAVARLDAERLERRRVLEVPKLLGNSRLASLLCHCIT
jgi:hypothetical protein